VTHEVLLIDDTEEFRQLAAQFLAIEWPDVEVEQWDPRARGEIPGFFPLANYDALLLDHELGLGDGLEWLARLVKREDCPPVVFLAECEDANVTAKAMQRGAFEYLHKRDLSRSRLIEAVTAAAAERAARAGMRRELRARVNQLEGARVLQGKPGGSQTEKPTPQLAINGYRILDKIGSGGMATVYLAERLADRLRLVIKVMNAKLTAKSEFLKRFIQEYALVSRVDCPQVVRIHDQGVTDQHVYIAMEHFAGGDLRTRIRNGLTPSAALDILGDVARALQAIHAHGIVHRDLKPDNVMFRTDGSLGIVDFGIATENVDGGDLTARGDVLGTPHYLSPEQARARPLDGRSDLYSLGIVFFEMLTGKRPFKARDAAALAHKHVNEPLPRLPPSLARYQELVDCLTAKRPEDRFGSADELLAYLGANANMLRSDADAKTVGGQQPVDASHNEAGAEQLGPRSILHVHATLARLGGDSLQLAEAGRQFTRTVRPLLTLIADAVNDSNVHFLHEAARALQTAISAFEAPVALRSAAELERHARMGDVGAAAATFLTTHWVVRSLMSELAGLTGGDIATDAKRYGSGVSLTSPSRQKVALAAKT
jgi:serine/threonine protein kinase/FixJ family two-component response regulator